MFSFNLRTNLVGEPTYLGDFLSADECAALIRFGEDNLELREGRTEDHTVHAQLRRSDIGWLNPDGPQRWLFDRLRACINDVNGSWFGYNLIGFEGIQFTRYSHRAEEGSEFYSSHKDTATLPGGTVRKLSFTLQLSPPDAYGGGDVILYNSLIDTITLGRSAGSITFFPSFTIHEVQPVTRGVRHSLVGWAYGPAFT